MFKVCKDINRRCRENPDKKLLIVFVLAGHGMQVGGQQVLLLNEFKNGFYAWFAVEGTIRVRAEFYSNIYQIGIFACCREIHGSKDHYGCFGGTKE